MAYLVKTMGVEARAKALALRDVPRARCPDQDLNAWLTDRCVAWARAQPHPEVRDKSIWEMFEAERPSLVPYAGFFDGFHSIPASVSKTCLVRFDNNKYSVAASAVGRPVEIRAYAERIEVRQGDLMERSETLEAMGGLKLFGMKAAYDELIATAVKRQHEPQKVVGDLLTAELSEKQARSIKYQITIAKLPLAKDIAEFVFDATPINETLVRDIAGGSFLLHQRNLVLIGGTGTGKTHLAVGIARACSRRCGATKRP